MSKYLIEFYLPAHLTFLSLSLGVITALALLRMPFVLKVFIGGDEKVMKFKDEATVNEALAEIVEGNKLSSPEHYLLYSETNNWLDGAQPLSSYSLKVQAEVQLLRSFQLCKILVVTGESPEKHEIKEVIVAIDFGRPIEEWQRYLLQKCKLPTSGQDEEEGHTLYVQSVSDQLTKADTKASPKDQKFPPGSVFCLLPNQGNFVKPQDGSNAFVASVLGGRGGPRKDVPASEVRDVAIKGKVFRASPKKKFEGVFIILSKSSLYVYKNAEGEKPLVVINMNNYSVRVVNKKKCIFELVPRDGGTKGEVGKGDGGLEAFRFDDGQGDTLAEWVQKLNNVAGVRSLSTGSPRRGENNKKKQEDVVRPKNIYGGMIGDACIDNEEIPHIITSTIEWLDERALDIEGIFRLSGDANKIKAYREQYNNGEEVNIKAERNPHNVAGILKLYLRELADPILPYDFYSDFMAAETCTNTDAKRGYTRHLVWSLPTINRVTLKYLINFLKKVDAHKEQNNMAIHNLATVFGPNLIKAKNETMFSMAASTAQTNSVVHTLIDGYDEVFGDEPFVLPSDKPTGVTAEAKFDYEGSEGERQLCFKANDLLCVVQSGADGWWRGGRGSSFGKFPGSFVSQISEGAAVRGFRKQQYTIKMEKMRKQLEEEEEKVAEMEKQKERLLEVLATLDEEKTQLSQKADGTVAEVRPHFAENEFLGTFLTAYEWNHRLQTRHAESERLKGSFLEEMTSLKNGLPATTKKKPSKGQPTLDTLRMSFDNTKSKLQEDMDLCRAVYSSAPPSTSSTSDQVMIDGKMRGENIGELFGVVKRIVGSEEVDEGLKGSVAQIEAFSAQCHDEVAKSPREEDKGKKGKESKKESKKTKKGRLF